MSNPSADLPSISVVTCSFNQAPFLEETLKSVIGQNYPRLEYMVIDGGSSDGSQEIIRRYENHLAYWESEKDNGQGHALSKGFNRATGDVMCWVGSDDLLEPGALLDVGSLFASNPDLMVAYGDTLFIDEHSNVTRHYKTFPFNRWIFLNTEQYTPQPSTFWRREIYQAVGGVNPTAQIMVDGDLFLRFSERTALRHIRRPWSRMRFHSGTALHPGTITVSRRAEVRCMQEVLRRRYYGGRSRTTAILARAAAKVARISCRLAYGCYW